MSNRADDVKEKDHCGWVLKDSPSLDFVRKPPPKAVDDDLYKISPDLLLSVTTNKVDAYILLLSLLCYRLCSSLSLYIYVFVDAEEEIKIELLGLLRASTVCCVMESGQFHRLGGREGKL